MPVIAQLAERETVVLYSKLSLGHWFKSGSRDFFSHKIFLMIINKKNKKFPNYKTKNLLIQEFDILRFKKKEMFNVIENY